MSEKRKYDSVNGPSQRGNESDSIKRKNVGDHRPTSLNVAKHLYGRDGVEDSTSILGKREREKNEPSQGREIIEGPNLMRKVQQMSIEQLTEAFSLHNIVNSEGKEIIEKKEVPKKARQIGDEELQKVFERLTTIDDIRSEENQIEQQKGINEYYMQREDEI